MIRLAAAVLAAAALTGCGGDDGGRFDEQVQRVREAVQAGDRDAAHEALDQIAMLGLDAGAAGELADTEVQELAQLVDQGRGFVDEELPPPPTTTTTTVDRPDAEAGGVETVPTDDPEDDDEGWWADDEGDEDGDDRGRGKGHKGKGD